MSVSRMVWNVQNRQYIEAKMPLQELQNLNDVLCHIQKFKLQKHKIIGRLK